MKQGGPSWKGMVRLGLLCEMIPVGYRELLRVGDPRSKCHLRLCEGGVWA
jgi:hypothetical protein